jgi:class 3 adenylate cyclase
MRQMNDVAKPKQTAVSAQLLDRLKSGIAESRASTVLAGGGKPYLRMLKSGEWVYGQRDDEVHLRAEMPRRRR